MSKRHVDELFQEKFKDFQSLPDEKVWQAIEASLDKKEKSRRVIPIWWKIGGAAAVLALLWLGITTFTQTESNPNTNAVTQEEHNNVPTTQTEENNVITSPTENNISLEEATESQVASSTENNQSKKTNTVASSKTNTNNTKNNASSKAVYQNNNITANNGLAATSNSTKKTTNDSSYSEQPNNTEVAVTTNNNSLVDKDNNKESFSSLSSTNDAIANTETKEDSISTVTKENKSLFDEIKKAEEEEEAIAENSNKKWSLGPNVAPVYFNGMGKGSPIDQQFSSNAKSGEVNLSYGLTLAYQINDKLSIRSGVQKSSYAYNTNDIVFSSLNGFAANMANIDYSNKGADIVIESANAPKEFLDNSPNKNEVQTATNSLEGTMHQQFGYLEMPLELNYALIDKKFGLHVIGGLSSMFLLDNTIMVESRDLNTEVGEANNLNTLNFSTNIGVGLNYKLGPKTQFNLEPMFKYYLNTFSDGSGDFQPFSIGVFSGLQLKF